MIEINTLLQLKRLDCQFNQPFSIRLREHQLQCDKVLRILPKKRVVVQALWRNQVVVAKLFFSRRAEQHMRRELQGSRMLSRAKIPTPEIILYGQSLIPSVYFVIYKYVEHSIDIQEEWINKQSPKMLETLLASMQDILVLQHKNGLYYSDSHPHNFIFGKDKVYLIDTTDVRCEHYQLALSVKQSIQNLVVLYSQLSPKFQPIILEAFRRYCIGRSWKISDELENGMLNALYQKRCVRLRRFLMKSLSSSKMFMAQFFCFSAFAATREEVTDDLKRFFKSPKEYFFEDGVLKNGNTCTAFKTTINDKPVVVKRYNIKSFSHLLRIFWRQSRALKSWKNANALGLLCISSPKPIAFYERRILWFFHGKAYYIANYVNGPLLKDYLPDVRDSDEFQRVAKQVGDLFCVFKEMKIVHGDMKATNFVLNEGKVYLLDLDAMRICLGSKAFEKGHQKDIERFLKNWENHPEIAEYFRSALVYQ